MNSVIIKAKELEVIFQNAEVAPWLNKAKDEILEDYRHFIKNLENLAMCNSDFKPVEGNPMHLRRENAPPHN